MSGFKWEWVFLLKKPNFIDMVAPLFKAIGRKMPTVDLYQNLISKLYRAQSEFKQNVLYCAVGLYVILLLYSEF